MNTKPYLSIVATMDERRGSCQVEMACRFVEGVFHQAKKNNFSVELIIVECHLVAEEPLLRKALAQQEGNKLVTLRYIPVASTTYGQKINSKPPFSTQAIAKNVGIRRANGIFVLCTHTDVLFSDACFLKLSKKKLKTGCFYSSIHGKVPKEMLEFSSVDERLLYCSKHVLRYLGKLYPYKRDGHYPSFFYYFPRALFLLDILLGIPDFIRQFREPRLSIKPLNLEGCGDFFLMAKSDWYRILGYVELASYTLHADKIAMIAAYAIGMKQKIFPFSVRTYHIDDGVENKQLFIGHSPEEIIIKMEKRPTSYWNWELVSRKLLIEQGKPFTINGENWGLKDVQLKEENLVEGRG